MTTNLVMFAYEKKLFWEIRLWILLIPRSLGCDSVKITEQWTEFDMQYFLFYLCPADEPFPCLLQNVNICNTLSCMWYQHLFITWHSNLPSERRNNNACNFKDKRKCQSCKNLANSFTSWKLLVIKGKRNHWERLSADCPECIMPIRAGAGRCPLQCSSRSSWGKRGWSEATHKMKTCHAPSWSNNHSAYPTLIYTAKLIGLILKLLSNRYHNICIFSSQNCM